MMTGFVSPSSAHPLALAAHPWVYLLILPVVVGLGLLVRRSAETHSRRSPTSVPVGTERETRLPKDAEGFDLIPPDAVQSHPVTLADVAGIDEVKSELRELIDFLTNPDVYTKLGARMPKGYILYGPPGTGKTLLARAIATECKTAFIHASGSSFVNKYVGAGASKVRQFFGLARQHAPIVAFIDEIDAMGKERAGGTNQEYDHCLNELLVQMDGFKQNDRMVLIAATNNYHLLDKALLRPGRFDRHIAIPLPDIHGRRAIFHVHCRRKPVGEDVDLDELARLTFGFTGAQIENITNEAALLAARRRADVIGREDFMEGIERVVVGLRSPREITPETRRIIALHEAGHAVMGYLAGFRATSKITLLPRGQALGYVMTAKENDDPLEGENEMYAQLQQMLGGRAAEEVYAHTRTSGAAADLEQASHLVRQMVYRFGMGETLLQQTSPTESLDANADRILHRTLEETKSALRAYGEVLVALTEELLRVESMTGEDFERFMKQRVAQAGLPSRRRVALDTGVHVFPA